jgi:hypothetical protein
MRIYGVLTPSSNVPSEPKRPCGWQREFIARWKEEELDTTAAEELLAHLECRLRHIERECG